MERIEKIEPLAIGPPRDQRHLAPAQRIIGKLHRARRAQAGNGEAGDAVAQLRGQGKPRLGASRARLESGFHTGKLPRHPGRIRPDCRDRHFERPLGAAPEHIHRDLALLEAHRAEPEHRARAFDHPHRPMRLERGKERRAAFAGKAVGKPDGIEIAFIRESRDPSGRRRWRPGCGLEAGKAALPGLRPLKGQGAFGQIGKHHNGHRTPVRSGLFQQRIHALDAPGPA